MNLVIWNPSAGASQANAELRDQLVASPRVILEETKGSDDATRAVRQSLKRGCRRVIAAGGDGTVHTVVAAIHELIAAGEPAPELAVLPLGTGNDLARSLGMPLDPLAAIEICLTGAARPLDLIVFESSGETHISANMVTAGNTGKYTSILADDMKRRWGPLCYLRGGVDVLQELDVYEVELRFDDEPAVNYSALNLFFANGRTSGGGLVVSPEAELDDGLIDVVVIRDGTPFDLAALTIDYLLSDIRGNDLIEYRRCRGVRIQSTPALPFSADGDAVEAASGNLRVLPAAINAVRGFPPEPEA